MSDRKLDTKRAVFVRANTIDDDGEVFRAGQGERVDSFDLYLQVPGGLPQFEGDYIPTF